MGLLRKLFWIALFLGLTFSFVVIFEHGIDDLPKNFPANARTEYKALQAFFEPATAKKTDGLDSR